MRRLLAVATMCVLAPAARADADTITLSALASGFYRENGTTNQPTGTGYLVGWEGGTGIGGGGTPVNLEFRDFFTFDATPYAGQISAAQLQLFNPRAGFQGHTLDGYESVDSTETFTLFDVSTNVSTLTSGLGGVSAFTDLGSGVSFGFVTVSSANNGTLVTIDINAAGLAALNSANGIFAFGGALTTLSKTPNLNELLFSNTSAALFGDTRQLVLTTSTPAPVPEPTSLLLLGTGVAGVVAKRRLRRTASDPRQAC